MLDIPCIIFAGGKSSRMGEDKALLPFGEFPTLTQYQLVKLQQIFKTVYISCKNSNKFDFSANFIEDVQTKDIYAPTIGFISVFEQLKAENIFVISVDTPFISEKEILNIIKHDNSTFNATIAKTSFGMHPMCGIYHRSLEVPFKEMLNNNNHKLRFLLKTSKTAFVNFDNESPFLNLNNPDDYTKALTLV